MRRAGGRLALALGTAWLVATPAAAQGVPAELSFEEAVAVALERNPAYLQQRNQVAASEYRERQSLGQAFLPSLNGSVGFGASNSLRQSWEEDSGEIRSGSVESTSSSASQGLGTSLSLFDWQRVQSYRAARAETEASAAGAANQAAVLRTLVGQAYYEAVQRTRLVEVERRTLETARAQLSAVRQLLRIAAKQPTDVLGAELAVLQAEQSVQQAEGEARKAGLRLRERMGVPMDADFTLTSSFPEVFDPSTLDRVALAERAVRASPRMLEQVARVDAADRGLAASRASRFPTVSLGAGWNRGQSARDLDALGEFDLPNRTYSASLSVAIPLFNQFSTTAAVGQAAVRLDNAEEGLREARLAVEREVREAVIDLENAHTAVRVAERSVAIARERLDQGQELYRLGSLGYENLQQMIDAVANAERGLVGARARFAGALLQLEEKVGGAVGR